MPTNMYSDEFKADAVALYESRPELSYSRASADLGIARATLKTWVHKARKAAGKVPTYPDGSASGEPETYEEELARLRIENEALRDEKKALRGDVDRLTEERTILQKATKYFAAETNW